MLEDTAWARFGTQSDPASAKHAIPAYARRRARERPGKNSVVVVRGEVGAAKDSNEMRRNPFHHVLGSVA